MQYEKPSVSPLFTTDASTEPEAISVVVIVIAAAVTIAGAVNTVSAANLVYAVTEVEAWSSSIERMQ